MLRTHQQVELPCHCCREAAPQIALHNIHCGHLQACRAAVSELQSSRWQKPAHMAICPATMSFRVPRVASTACVCHCPGRIGRHDSLPHSMCLKGHCTRPPQHAFAAYSQHPGSSSCLPYIMCQQGASGSLHSMLADVYGQAMAPGESVLQHECYRAADKPTARAHLHKAA